MPNPSGYRFTDSTQGWPSGVDFDDVFVRADAFIEGGLWLWGDGYYGILGNISILDKSSPIQTVSGGTNWKQVSAGNYSSAAIKNDGTLWVWGGNTNGQLGDNTIIWKSSPIQTVSGGTNWKQVSVGSSNMGAIKTDGTLWLWGDYGANGSNSITSTSSPVQTICSGNNWKQVSCSSDNTAAIKTDGTLWVWGRNGNGQNGDNTTIRRSSPVQTVSGGTDWKRVSCGDASIAAIKTDGTLWVWGVNSNGGLGDNTIIAKSSPVQTICSGTNWKQIAGGYRNMAAIKTDGTLWGWGSNTSTLGDNSIIDRSSPVQTICSGTNWKQVDVRFLTVAAIKTDGTLWTWGRNDNGGTLGDNTIISKSSPVQTVAGGTGWKQVSSHNQVLAIRDFYN